MSTSDYRLAPRPKEPRARELWLQHAAGFILFEDVREYARSRLDANLGADAREAAERAIDDALYGMMMVADGVTGSLSNKTNNVEVRVSVRLVSRATGRVRQQLDLFEGDGACMGFHGWREGDFGEDPVAKRP